MHRHSEHPSPPLPCPELPSEPSSCQDHLETVFVNAPTLAFGQHWRASLEPQFQSGTISIGWHGENFYYLARLRDRCPHTSATARNQHLWLLGDVLELFAGVHGSPSYIECHTAPNGEILQLHWPCPEALAESKNSPLGIAPFMRVDDSAAFVATTTPAGWNVLGRIPATLLTPPHGTLLRGSIWDINFGRYDYSGPNSTSTLSSTSPLTQPHFHRRAEWTTIRFV